MVVAEVASFQQSEFEESPDQKLTPAQKIVQGFPFTDLTDEEKEELVFGLIEYMDKYYPVPPVNPLFQLFSVSVEFKKDSDKQKHGKLYGNVQVVFGDHFVSLFDYEPHEHEYLQPISNKGLVLLKDPNPFCSVSASSTIELDVVLSVRFEDDDEDDRVVDVSDTRFSWEHQNQMDRRRFDYCESRDAEHGEGYVKVYFILLERAVQATMKVTFNGDEAVRVIGNIVAYYGDFVYDCSPDEKDFYKLTLFEAKSDDDDEVALLKTGEIPLLRSMLAVPGESSLIIEAHLKDPLRNIVLDGIYNFDVKLKGSTTTCIEERRGCSFHFISER